MWKFLFIHYGIPQLCARRLCVTLNLSTTKLAKCLAKKAALKNTDGVLLNNTLS
jgi:hypothetical protein